MCCFSCSASTRARTTGIAVFDAHLRDTREGCQCKGVALLGDDALQVPRGHRRLMHARHDALQLCPQRIRQAPAALRGSAHGRRATCRSRAELPRVERAVHGGVHSRGLIVHGGVHDVAQHVEVEKDLECARNVCLAEGRHARAQQLVASRYHLCFCTVDEV